MELNLTNTAAREIFCNRVETDQKNFPNCNLLRYGKTYHLTALKVYNWHSVVYLKEFPGKEFNSVQFAEFNPIIFGKLKINSGKLKKLETEIKANGHSSKTIAILGNHLPDLLLSGEYAVSLSKFKKPLELMNIGDVFTIGRNAESDIVLPNNNIFSRIHCYLVREANNRWVLKDASLNGTAVSL